MYFKNQSELNNATTSTTNKTTDPLPILQQGTQHRELNRSQNEHQEGQVVGEERPTGGSLREERQTGREASQPEQCPSKTPCSPCPQKPKESIALTILASPSTGPTIIRTIAQHLESTYGTLIETREYKGWAQLGVLEAAVAFDPKKFQGETLNLQKRVSSYLITKGKYLAIDRMRAAGIVDRTRGGKLVQQPIYTTPLTIKNNCIINPHTTSPALIVEQQDTIARLIFALDAVERAIIDAVIFMNKSIVEAGRIVHLSMSKAYAIYHRAIEKMKRVLARLMR